MKNNRFWVFATLAALAAAPPAIRSADSVVRYGLDAAHGNLAWSIDFWGINEIRGVFESYEGEIVHDEGDIAQSSVHVFIDVPSVDSGVDRRDEHLLQDDYFNAEAYPHMVFQSKRIAETDDGLQAVGDFFLHGVTREIVIPFEFKGPVEDTRGRVRVGVVGSAVIKRTDYGMDPGPKLDDGTPMISDEVRIDLNISGLRR